MARANFVDDGLLFSLKLPFCGVGLNQLFLLHLSVHDLAFLCSLTGLDKKKL